MQLQAKTKMAKQRISTVLGAFSVKPDDIIRRYGCSGPDRLPGGLRHPLGPRFRHFWRPKMAIVGLDLGVGCTGSSLRPVQKYTTYTEPPPSVPTRVKLGSFSPNICPKINSEQLNSSSSVLIRQKSDSAGTEGGMAGPRVTLTALDNPHCRQQRG